MILIGTKCRLEQTVTDALTAANVGSGALPVFGTPYMSALMENAAMTCLQSFLEEGQGSVGTHLDISHDAPTPIGMKVWAEAEITAVSENGKMVDFAVKAWDESGPLGSGTHPRAIVKNENFWQNAMPSWRRSNSFHMDKTREDPEWVLPFLLLSRCRGEIAPTGIKTASAGWSPPSRRRLPAPSAAQYGSWTACCSTWRTPQRRRTPSHSASPLCRWPPPLPGRGPL